MQRHVIHPFSRMLIQVVSHACSAFERVHQLQGVGLCHGIAGNGYALLSLYQLTDDEMHLWRAQHFGAFMAEHWQQLYEVPDAPAALYLVCSLSRFAMH